MEEALLSSPTRQSYVLPPDVKNKRAIALDTSVDKANVRWSFGVSSGIKFTSNLNFTVICGGQI